MLSIKYVRKKYQEPILEIQDAHNVLIPTVGNTVHHNDRTYVCTGVSHHLSSENDDHKVTVLLEDRIS